MSLLLTTTTTAGHHRPAGADSHGWTGGDYTFLGVMAANIQPRQEAGDTSAGDSSAGYSAGPGRPGQALLATVYVDADADLRPGDRLTAHGNTWQIETVVVVPGPISPDLDVIRATASAYQGVE